MAAEQRLVGQGTEALEECVANLLIGEVLRVRNEATSEAKGKGKVRL